MNTLKYCIVTYAQFGRNCKIAVGVVQDMKKGNTICLKTYKVKKHIKCT